MLDLVRQDIRKQRVLRPAVGCYGALWDLRRSDVRTLVQAFRNTGKLTPVLLWKDARETPSRLVLLDGRHRLAAYEVTMKERKGRRPGVLAGILEGTFADAMSAAVDANTKDALPLTSLERTDAAWRLVRTFDMELSKARIAAVSGVSQRTVANMRRRWKVIQETDGEADGAWWRDRDDKQHDYSQDAAMNDTQRAKLIFEMAGEFKAVAANREKWQADVVAQALEKAFGHRLQTMFEFLYEGIDELREFDATCAESVGTEDCDF